MKVKISVIKFEVVDGKKTGRAFSFDMDPKAMAEYKTEATVRRKVEEYVAKSGVFKRSELADLKYNMKDFLEEWKKQVPLVEAEKQAQLERAESNSRVTPERITQLGPNEVFVFGSNAQGLHYGGAARQAVESFGAVMGQGHGMQGQSYAINSMSGIAGMKEDVEAFRDFAEQHPEKRFLVTLIGCGIAGYKPAEVAPLFKDCKDLNNVYLPAAFWKIIGAPEKHYDLERFVKAQARVYEEVLEELRNGQKCSHWIWFIFPQQKGLGRSFNSEYYGLDGVGEAQAYWAHPVLGARLRECCELLLTHQGKRDIDFIMGSSIDVLKLQTSMNLFNRVSPNDIFQQVLVAFFGR